MIYDSGENIYLPRRTLMNLVRDISADYRNFFPKQNEPVCVLPSSKPQFENNAGSPEDRFEKKGLIIDYRV